MVFNIQEVLRNPIAFALLLPLLPLIIITSLLANLGAPPLPAMQTTNLEEWRIYEDPKTGEIKITVHRNVVRRW